MMLVQSRRASSRRLRKLVHALEGERLLRVRPASAWEYEAITDDDFKCEYVPGELILHSAASLPHEDLAAFLITLLRIFVSDRRLGRVFGSNAVMQLGESRFSPDISVLLNESEHRVQRDRVVGPMDLAVELVSRSTRSHDRKRKLPIYLEHGVREVWLVDRKRKTFEAHRPGSPSRMIELQAGVFESAVLPGLKLDVGWLWQDPLPPLSRCVV